LKFYFQSTTHVLYTETKNCITTKTRKSNERNEKANKKKGFELTQSTMQVLTGEMV